MSLVDKVILVTGAHRGIGLAIAHELAKLGAKVAACDLSVESAAELTLFFKKRNLEGKGLVMDVTKSDSIDAALLEISALYGPPQILVNNAGIALDNLILRMSDEEWQRVIDTNLTSVFLVTKRCLRGMIKARWGRIINIASMVGCTGNAGQASYAASKAGIIAFTKSLAQESASRMVTVNAVAPGFIDTIMTKQIPTVQREEWLKIIPMKRAGQPEEVAKAVAFLASEDASYITGITLHINGGMFMG